MTIVLYRPSLRLNSGAGQLIRIEAEGFRAAGERIVVACERGGLGFLLRAGRWTRRMSARRLTRLAASPEHLVVDHGAVLPSPDIVFVHNVVTEALRYLDRPEWYAAAQREAAWYAQLPATVPIVANSELVRTALIGQFGLAGQRVRVVYPGYDAARFDIGVRSRLRARARRELGLTERTPLLGFVTSGDLAKRGIDVFLAVAERVAAVRDDARFLVVGSQRLPEGAARHSLARSGRLQHRPKSRAPEAWYAALDLFLYPARFEEFGLVVAEALAMGVPVLTSRRVGAAECLPAEYAEWIADRPEPDRLAALALTLLDDDSARDHLAAAGVGRAAALSAPRHVAAALTLVRECRRAKAKR